MKRSRLSRGEGSAKKQRLERAHTMEDVVRLNAKTGHYFFSPDTMRFFNSCVESGLIGMKYFITSEKRGGDPYMGVSANERLFSIREYNQETGGINTVGEFQGFNTRAQAIKKAMELAGD